VLPHPTREFRSPSSRITLFQIFLLFVWALGAEIGTLFIAGWLHASTFTRIMLEVGVGSTVWLLGYQVLAERRGWESLQVRFRASAAKPLLAGAAMAVALILLANGESAALQLLGVKIAVPSEPFLIGGLEHLPVLILVVVIIGPMAEELIFRGLFLDWLKQKLAPWVAAVIASLGFALVHNNHLLSGAVGWFELFNRFLIGMSASWLVLRYKSLAPSFVMHAMNNCLVVVVNALQIGST
jgi:hypothetical protein